MQRRLSKEVIQRYVTLLQECITLSEARSLHGEIVERGLEQDRLVINHLVQMYGKCGSLQDAKATFERMTERNVFTWNVMLVALVENAGIREAREFFERMPELGGVGATTMITAYARYGDLSRARETFESMPWREVVAWGALMSAHTRNGEHKRAAEIFRRMDAEGVKPTQVIFIIALESCTLESEAEALRLRISSGELHADVKLQNTLMNTYSRVGRWEKSWEIFSSLPERNSVTWNTMISAFARNERCEEALRLFKTMALEGVKGTKVTFLNVVEACGNSMDVEEGRYIHRLVRESGFEEDVVVGTAVISMFGKCNSLKEAYQLFRRMAQRTVVSWTAMISSFSRDGSSLPAVGLLREMHLEGVRANEVTFLSVLDSIAAPSALSLGREVHASLAGSSLESAVKVCNALITMYGKCGSVRSAEQVFHRVVNPDVITWTAMLSTYAHNELGESAMSFFRKMDVEGVRPVSYTFASVLEACSQTWDVRLARLVHSCMEDIGLTSDPLLGNALMSMYGKLGSLEHAEAVFQKLNFRSVVSWTTMIELYSRAGGTKAVETLASMDLEGCRPNEVTYVSTVDACAEMSSVALGRLVQEEITSGGIPCGTVLGNSLTNMYAKCGSLERARESFRGMICRDSVSWNTLMAACSHLGDVTETLEVFYEMNLRGFAPSEPTFSSVLSACCHTGLVEVGVRVFVSIGSDFWSVAAADHYSCMVEVFARGGLVEAAEELVNLMPYEPDARAWNRLLSACRMEGDVERAQVTAERFCELSPDETSGYVLLSNTYKVDRSCHARIE